MLDSMQGYNNFDSEQSDPISNSHRVEREQIEMNQIRPKVKSRASSRSKPSTKRQEDPHLVSKQKHEDIIKQMKLE